MKLTRRCARITIERATKLQTIINHMRKGPLTICEIQDIVGIGQSGTHKYIDDLCENRIAIKTKYTGSKPRIYVQYRLIDDPARVEEFLRLITLPGVDGQPRRRGSNVSTEDCARKVHITKDDEPIKIKLGAKKPPKQFDLLLYLFGMNMEVA